MNTSQKDLKMNENIKRVVCTHDSPKKYGEKETIQLENGQTIILEWRGRTNLDRHK